MRFSSVNFFARSESGSMSVEAVFAIPILAWAMTATFVFFDAFKTQNMSQKAAYTVADMISREEAPIDDNYLTAMHETFDYLSGGSGDNAIRVSIVEMTRDEVTEVEALELIWSEGVNVPEYILLDPIEDRIPSLSVGEQIILVETEQEWTPAFAVGLASYRFREVAVARPRFSSRICWETTAGCTTEAPVVNTGGTDGDGEV